MGIKCAHLFAYLFLSCYERELSNDKQADIIDAFIT